VTACTVGWLPLRASFEMQFECLELAEFGLMHCNIMARWHTAMLNGGNRPKAALCATCARRFLSLLQCLVFHMDALRLSRR
jgi:hypothetical protein